MAISEKSLWALPHPKDLKQTIFTLQDMLHLASSEDSQQLVGLPSYHLQALSQATGNWTPRALLFIAGCSEEQFLGLCKKFDEDFIKDECIELSIAEQYRQERIAQAIILAIIRSDLDVKKVSVEILNPWKQYILNGVESYIQGTQKYTGLKAQDLFKL